MDPDQTVPLGVRQIWVHSVCIHDQKQSEMYLNLSVTIHINYSIACCLKMLSISWHVPLSGHDDVALFE